MDDHDKRMARGFALLNEIADEVLGTPKRKSAPRKPRIKVIWMVKLLETKTRIGIMSPNHPANNIKSYHVVRRVGSRTLEHLSEHGTLKEAHTAARVLIERSKQDSSN